MKKKIILQGVYGEGTSQEVWFMSQQEQKITKTF